MFLRAFCVVAVMMCIHCDEGVQPTGGEVSSLKQQLGLVTWMINLIGKKGWKVERPKGKGPTFWIKWSQGLGSLRCEEKSANDIYVTSGKG